MPVALHTCAPPKDQATKAQTLWVCPRCGATWEAAPDPGIFDFERNDVVTRAIWLRVDEADARFDVA
jgi:hypothetical protein